jgi:GR25 family glycosyltransferase involved in LPS biosynthesis
MKLNEYFDKIYCINLDRRVDRWEECQDQFKKHNLSVERFSAIDGLTIENKTKLANGELGILKTHIELIKDAKEKGYKNILILEDDVEFTENLNEKFSSVINQIPNNWIMLYLGANHVGGVFQLSENICQVIHSYAIHAFAINSELFDLIINGLPKYKKPVDVFYAELQPLFPSYVIRPHLAWQRVSFSDIQGGVMNYEFLKK